MVLLFGLSRFVVAGQTSDLDIHQLDVSFWTYVSNVSVLAK